jgi:hypothetical protein
MKNYEKPMILANEGLAEGVYAASGDVASGLKCDSKYMKGVWQPQTYGDGSEGYKKQYGCLGCPAYTASGCGIAEGNHYDQSGNAKSYETDNGKRKPAWEWNGFGPYDTVTDWSNCGNQVGEDKS